MRRFRFSTHTEFSWKGKDWRVIRRLANRKVNIEDIETMEILVHDLDHLILEHFEGKIIPKGKEKSDNPSNIKKIHMKEWGDLSAHQQQEAERRLEIIKPFLEDPVFSKMTYAQYVSFLKTEANKLETQANYPKDWPSTPIEMAIRGASLGPLSESSFQRWIKTYAVNGFDKRALAPKSDFQGARKEGTYFGEGEQIISSVINDKIFTRSGYKKDEARPDFPPDTAIYLEVKQRVIDENKTRSPDNKLIIPSKRTINRRTDDLDEFEVYAARYGVAAAKRHFTQYGQHQNIGFMRRAEIDHTDWDVIVIDDADGLPLGKPKFTRIKEFKTKNVIGAVMGFEPGYYPVSEAIMQAILPKPDVKSLYGTRHDWKVCGMFDELVVDQGAEFIGKDLKDSCESAGIELRRLEKKYPQGKGSSEGGFNSDNLLLHTLDGTTFSNVVERGNYESEGRACLYLSELTKIYFIHVVDIYPYTQRGYERIYPGLEWEKEIDNGHVESLPFTPEELDVMFARVDSRVLFHYGVDRNWLRYNLKGTNNRLAKLRAKIEKLFEKGQLDTKEIKIKWHSNDLTHIHVYDQFEGDYIEVPALNQEYTKKVNDWKHRVIKRYAREEYKIINDETLALSYRDIQNIIENARKRAKVGPRKKMARWNAGGKETAENSMAQSELGVNTNLSETNLRDSQIRSYEETIDWLQGLSDTNTPDEWELGPNVKDL